MSEYKENTVGWWLSQLKEPLRGEMFGRLRRGETTHNCDTLSNALFYATSPSSFDSHYRLSYLLGIVMFYDGDARQELDHRANGWDMAKECAPDNWLKPNDGGEDKAIVDSPKKTRELFFYGGNIINPFKEPLVVSPRGEMLSVIVDEDKIKDLMNANLSVTFWPTNVGGVSPTPQRKSAMQDWYDQLPPSREIEAPERAVVGYEEPKPIDTIEKKHELKIQNLELAKYHQGKEIENLQARVEQLEGVVGKLEQQIEYVYRNLPKDFDGTR